LKLIDLKQNICLAPDYVRLRNEHSEALLTERVGIAQTEAWLAEDCVEVRCLVEGKELLGAAVLYLNKKGEIAFFSKRPGEAREQFCCKPRLKPRATETSALFGHGLRPPTSPRKKRF